jgi:predicted DNA-binding transcriptional regulator YafY
LPWQSVWTFYAWCELREDHRHFRVSRIKGLVTLEDRFPDTPDSDVKEMAKRFSSSQT